MHTLLIRHAEHALQDLVLVGRSPGVRLTTRGCEKARALGRGLRGEGVAAIQSSPRERCLETAEQISLALGIPVEREPALDELDCGAWTGQKFSSLEHDADWRAWNELRAIARPPGGESMRDVQRRILRHLESAARRGFAGPVVMVTHAELIRAALLHCRGLPLAAWNSVMLAPASVSRIEFGIADGTRMREMRDAAA
jgi:probable phosphoglycerate mutase